MSRVAMRRYLRQSALAAVAILLTSLGTDPAGAGRLGLSGWGVCVGMSSSPDQFVIGMNAGMGEPAENLRIRVAADTGLGDHMTLLTVGPDITYAIPTGSAGKLYFGGWLGILYRRMDRPLRGPHNVNRSSSELGVAATAGYEFILANMPLHLDLKVGITDEYPDFKLLLGYTFHY